jgi:NAD(P)H-hydrate epimerase
MPVGVVCGTGNNGGDGLGIARLLSEHGYSVKVWVVKGTVPESADFKLNLEEAKSYRIDILEVTNESDESFFAGRKILIDALFGSGLTRPISGIYEKVIECINKAEANPASLSIFLQV